MKAMQAGSAITAAMTVAALAAGLAGCSAPSRPDGWAGAGRAPVDGTRCEASGATSGPVYIDVRYAANGTPLDPGPCKVDSGTDVTWRGPSGEPVRFEIRFKAAVPLAPGERNLLPSTDSGGRYKVMRRISGPAGRYDYAIHANGKELDPVIIIR